MNGQDRVDFNEFKTVLSDIRELEQKINKFFDDLSKPMVIPVSRCSDYGERGVNVNLSFDNINVSVLTPDKIVELTQWIQAYFALRNKQRRFEHSAKVEIKSGMVPIVPGSIF